MQVVVNTTREASFVSVTTYDVLAGTQRERSIMAESLFLNLVAVRTNWLFVLIHGKPFKHNKKMR